LIYNALPRWQSRRALRRNSADKRRYKADKRKRCGRDLLTVAVRRGRGLLRLEAQALHSVLLVGDDFSGNR
jgi:hypothetical protein